MKQRTHLWIVLLWCVTLSLVWVPSEAQASARQPLFLHRNGYLISGPFLEFYERHGGAQSFGEPRTDAFAEPGGLTVQYFDYARFEWHDQVILSDLGRRAAAGHTNTAAFAWVDSGPAVAEGRTYFAEAGHSVGGAFGWFWQTRGGLALLGYPISEEFEERLPDGTGVLTQYFERAVLTYHPERVGTGDEVRRVQLGRQFAPERPTTPPPAVLGEARLPFQPGSGDGHNIAVAMGRLERRALAPGETLSFLAAAGPITRRRGYVAGSAIVGGKIVTDAVGGGVCTVSSLLYRVAWQAGLPVEERRGHSVWLQIYADRPGLEAAVEDPSLDLVIRNDTPFPIFIEALVSADSATLRLWGVPDGRVVTLKSPTIRSNASAASSPGAAVLTTSYRETGATVINTRTIKIAGRAPRREQVVTVYTPMPPAPGDEMQEEAGQS
jgi:hypothetical protein